MNENSQGATNGGGVEVLVGKEVCEIVTTGMYSDPLAFYREYIQNAVDALEAAEMLPKGVIEVSIDVSASSVTIRDNGPGMDHAAAVRALVPMAVSYKRRGIDRGFRGIGRLSALAFADKVTFATRRSRSEAVTEVVWDGDALRERLENARRAEDVIRGCVEVRNVEEDGHPEHFFEVRVADIHRHAAGRVLNSVTVGGYIGEVCPVPMRADFPFAKDVEGLLTSEVGPVSVRVVVNGQPGAITRPFGPDVGLSAARRDDFTDFERIAVPALGVDGPSAIGWVAHSSYQGAIPARAGIRGLRMRAGNIQVGDERVCDPLFPETRFNRWCVGEIHVIDPRLVPNARRDYFEAGPHTRNLENHLRSACRRIARRCRDASRRRLKERKVASTLREAENGYALAASGYLAGDDAEAILARVVEDLQSVREAVEAFGVQELKTKTRALESRVTELDLTGNGLAIDGISDVEATAYRKVFGAMVKVSRSLGAVRESIESIVAELARREERRRPSDRGEAS